MPDMLTDRLTSLAPEVDVDAGRELFERSRRARHGGPHRTLLAAAVVVLLVVGLVGVWALAGRDDVATVASEPTSPATSTPAAAPTTPVTTTPATTTPATTTPVTTAVTEGLAPPVTEVPLPEPGAPALVLVEAAGPLFVVGHDDGTASVLPAVVELPADAESGVVGLSALLDVAADGRGFAAGPRRWDEWGRAVDGPRTDDLVGYVGVVSGDRVEVSTSDRRIVPGVPANRPDDDAYASAVDLLPAPIELDALPATSSTGPVWRHVDATLVVERGVGSICRIGTDLPLDRLIGCPAGIPTAVTSTRIEITSWYRPTLLVEVDRSGRIGRVAALGGVITRDDELKVSASATAVPTVPTAPTVPTESAGPSGAVGGASLSGVAIACREPNGLSVVAELVVPSSGAIDLQVESGGAVAGTATVSVVAGEPVAVAVPIVRAIDGTARLVASAGGSILASARVPSGVDACPLDATA